MIVVESSVQKKLNNINKVCNRQYDERKIDVVRQNKFLKIKKK